MEQRQNTESDKNSYFTFRDKNRVNISKFHDQLQNTDWSNPNEFKNPLDAYEAFLDKYTCIYNSCFPLRKVKTAKSILQKPWLSKGLLKSIKKKNKLYKKFLNVPNLQNDFCYKNYKNKLNHLLRVAKRLHYQDRLDSAKSNMKSTWSILNEV